MQSEAIVSKVGYSLPQLPKGYYWNVGEDGFHITTISLRKTLFMGMSYKVDSMMVSFFKYKKKKFQGMYDPAEEIFYFASIMYCKYFNKSLEIPTEFNRDAYLTPHSWFFEKSDTITVGDVKLILETLSTQAWEANYGKHPGDGSRKLVTARSNKNLRYIDGGRADSI